MQTLREAVAAKYGDDVDHQIKLLQRRLHYAATSLGHREFPDCSLRFNPRQYIEEFHRLNGLKFTGE